MRWRHVSIRVERETSAHSRIHQGTQTDTDHTQTDTDHRHFRPRVLLSTTLGIMALVESAHDIFANSDTRNCDAYVLKRAAFVVKAAVSTAKVRICTL